MNNKEFWHKGLNFFVFVQIDFSHKKCIKTFPVDPKMKRYGQNFTSK